VTASSSSKRLPLQNKRLHRRLLRPCRERPRRRAAEQRDELPPLHSITSSARKEHLFRVRKHALDGCDQTFAFRIDIWDDTGDSIVEHVAGADDFEVAEATYRAAVARWPMARIARVRLAPRASHRRLSFHLRCAAEQLACGTA
jgi:hypothetical protein